MFRSFFKCGKPLPAGPIEYLIVGLGNPGKKYEATRHNIGFMAVDHIAASTETPLKKLRFQSLTGEALLGGKHILLMKPSTFMNLSGQAVREAAGFYKVPPEHILVISDDVCLDVGRMRIRKKGSDGGHNGLKNIIYLLGADTFPRIRIGVGKKPHPEMDLADFVLGRFSSEDLGILEDTFSRTADAAALIVAGKIDEAMNRYNTK